MRKFIAQLLIAALLIPMAPAHAALTEPDKAIIQAGNLLLNPGWESGKASWTASGGTYTTDTTNKHLGNSAGSWDPSAASQTLTATAVSTTLNQGVAGTNGVLSCWVKTAATDLKMQVVDGSANVLTSNATTDVVPSSSAGFVRYSLNFAFPNTTGTVSARFVSQSDSAVAYIDDCYLGSAEGFNLSQVSQAKLVGQVKITGCSTDWTTTSTSFAAFAPQTGCTYTASGSATAPATNIPAITFPSLPAGNYVLKYEGEMYAFYSTASSAVAFQFYDGTNAANEQSYVGAPSPSTPITAQSGISQTISYTTAQTNVTLQIRGLIGNAGSSANIRSIAGSPGVISVYYFPTSSQTAYSPDTTAASWSGYHANTCAWQTTSTTYTDPAADATCTLTERKNTNFGTVVTYGSSLPGITFTPPKVGKYYVCATPETYNTVVGGFFGLELSDTSGTVVANSAYQESVAGGSTKSTPVCGVYDVTSAGSKTLRLRMKASTGTSTIGGVDTTIEWSIFQLDAAQPAPVLMGSVTSNTSGTERVERVSFGGAASTMVSKTVCSSTPCTIIQQSGSWVNSVTRVSTGVYVVNAQSGAFSSFPTCTCSSSSTGANYGVCATRYDSATGIRILIGSGATVQDDGVDLVCMGPR